MIDFENLFSSYPFRVLPSTLSSPDSSKMVTLISSHFNQTLSVSTKSHPVGYGVDIDSFREDWVDDVIITEGNGLFQPLHLDCQEFLFRKGTFYSQLTPSPFVESVISKVESSNQFIDHLVVGVHIRKYNSDFDWPVVPPHASSDKTGSGGVREALSFDQMGPLSLYSTPAKEFLLRHPNAKIFLSSNSMERKEEFIREVGEDSIITLNFPSTERFEFSLPSHKTLQLTGESSQQFRNQHQGIEAALIDMLVMSRCALILHTYGSSFASEAALLGGRDVPTIRVDDVSKMSQRCLSYFGALSFSTIA